MSGPPTVSVAAVWAVLAGGSPATDAPAGMAAPMSRPFGPVPTAGPAPGRRRKSARGSVIAVVFSRCGSAFELPTPFAFQSGSPAIAGKIDRFTLIVVVYPAVTGF